MPDVAGSKGRANPFPVDDTIPGERLAGILPIRVEHHREHIPKPFPRFSDGPALRVCALNLLDVADNPSVFRFDVDGGEGHRVTS